MTTSTETIIGIDLGTTNSVVSVVENGEPRVIAEAGESILPSVVGVTDSAELLVGHPARNQLVLAPERTVKSIKRKMGEDTKISLGNQEFTPQEISAVILRKLKQRAEADLKRPVTKAVITVPAFFKEAQRKATRAAGELAGLEVVRIINEPTAASLAYNAEPEEAEQLLVYDLGGGTFDVSLVQIEGGVVEVLASHGDTKLGGDDFDRLLMDHICDRFQEEHGIDLRDNVVARSRMLNAAEDAKKRLSADPAVQVEEEFVAEKDGVPLHVNMEVKRDDYQALILPLLEKTLACVDKALEDGKVTAEDLQRVLLVGGSTRTPLVHDLLNDRLGLPLRTDVDPDLCVALGAAVQGALIAGQDVSTVLVDITPHTLGVACVGVTPSGHEDPNHCEAVVRRNSPLPATASKIFYTRYDGQTAVDLDVYQGEHNDRRLNERVGECALEDLADVAEGNEILVKFTLNLDGVLHVTARERATGNENRITIDNALQRFDNEHAADAKARLHDAFESSDELRSVPSGEGGVIETTGRTVSDAINAFSVDTDSGADDGTGVGSAPEWKRVVNEELSEDMLAMIDRCNTALRTAKPLKDSATEEDVEELKELAARLQSAMESRSTDDMEQVLPQIEDLIFYLQDA